MAAQKRQNSQTPQKTNQAPDKPLSDRVREASARLADSAADETENLYDSARHAVQEGARRTQYVIRENPNTALFLGFGLGFGIGLVLANLLTTRDEPSWYERTMPEALRDIPGRVRDQVRDWNLREAVTRHFPGS